MKIIIATHKDKCYFDNSIFRPIQVNCESATYTIDKDYYQDDSGENISRKNQSFCELTALYWSWKNLREEDILGLNHYRRYFNFLNNSLFKPHRILEVNGNDPIIERHNSGAVKITERVKKWLNKNDVLLPYKRHIKVNKKYMSIADEYCKNHIESDWKTTMEIIVKKYPEYQESIDKYLNNSNEIYLMNVFVAKKQWVDSYCKWLFDILFEVEKNITISEDPYQRRVFGFISERLLTLYVKHNESKVKEMQLLFINDKF
ncbi:DUF4422 domain-containing protein [Flavobacterium sp. PLA-1-15]|uniref:DUF4422 domain-containing protein n=1 Tax=Flavobacterium sp. PLA-1-15 TaxID=3380533 RepID=UPI003B7FC0CD